MQEELMILGRKLASFRKEHELSLQDVGDAIGLTRGHVWKLENGIATPSFTTLTKLADFMNTSLFELFAPTNGLNPLTCARIIDERLAELDWTLEELQELTKIDYFHLICIAEGDVAPTSDEWKLVIEALGLPSQSSIEMVVNMFQTFLEGSGMSEEQIQELVNYVSENLK